MNIVRLNTTAPDGFVKGGNGNGGNSGGGMKYYDCLFDYISEEGDHGDWNLANVKLVNVNNGEVYIAPDGWNGIERPEDSNYIKVAVAVPQGRKYYANGQWLDEREMYENTSCFDTDAHIEITEDEFYHIPGDEVWMWYYNTQEDNKVQFEKLMALCKRYGEKIKSDGLPLYPWFKSLDVESYDGYDSYNVHPQTLLDYADTKSVAYIKFNTPTHNYDFCFLLKDGEYSIINQYELNDMVKTVFIWADYGEREVVFNQLEAICQENMGNVNTSGVALSDYYPILRFEFCDKYDCTSRDLDRIIGYEKDGDTTRIRIKTADEYDEVIELVRDGGAYSGTFNGDPIV